VLGGGALLFGGLAGAGFGAIVSSLIASHEHNHELDRFQEAIESGEILLIVDVPRSDVDHIQEMIREHHPEVEISITESSQPARLTGR
jgi:hypothetical protein